VCGPHSALGLEEAERELWPDLRERLRQPGRLMALMRGILGGDAEVAVVTAVTPAGVVQPLAVLVTPLIADEIELTGDDGDQISDQVSARIGGDPIDVLMSTTTGSDRRPVAVLVNPWIFSNLTLFTRKLWTRIRRE
jgi:hypothetical protein